MDAWGTIPDWLSAVIAFVALLLFIIVERERLILRGRSMDIRPVSIPFSDENQGKTFIPSEYRINIRAELYSRILIGIILGTALNPIYSWATFTYMPNPSIQPDYESKMIVENTLILVSTLVISTIMLLVYLRAYSGRSSIFVHWVEKAAFSYIGFELIFSMSSYELNLKNNTSYLHCDSGFNIFCCVILLLLIGFQSTPIDWIIRIINKFKGRKKAKN